MRKKDPKPLNVADGFSFDDEEIVEEIIAKPLATVSVAKAKQKTLTIIDDALPKSYYKPHPKKGSQGGDLGRKKVDPSKKRVQFSLTCTPEQKVLYMEAAEKDNRKLPDFVNNAIQEYIRNHNL